MDSYNNYSSTSRIADYELNITSWTSRIKRHELNFTNWTVLYLEKLISNKLSRAHKMIVIILWISLWIRRFDIINIILNLITSTWVVNVNRKIRNTKLWRKRKKTLPGIAATLESSIAQVNVYVCEWSHCAKFRQNVDFIKWSDEDQWSDSTFGKTKRLFLMIFVLHSHLSDNVVFAFVDTVNHSILICIGDVGFALEEQNDVSFGWLLVWIEPFLLGHQIWYMRW